MKGRDKYSVKNCHTTRQFERAVSRQGGWRSEGGRHAKLHHPRGGSVPIPTHRGDIATGTRCSIVTKLLLLGFGLTPICLLVWLVMGLSGM